MIIFLYISLFCTLAVLFIIGSLFLLIFNKKRIHQKIEKFELYIVVLEYHMKKAYDIIYKDKIFVYSLEGMKINDEDFNIASKEFVRLTLKMIGTNLKEEFIELYGDEDTLIFNIVEYFNDKIETDEIREKSKQNLLTAFEDSVIKEELNK